MPPRGSIVEPSTSVLQPMAHDAVQLRPGFWFDVQERNSRATIPHVDRWMTRVGWIENFAAVAEGRGPQERRGREFTDANVYNLIEALTWDQARRATEEPRRAELVALLEAAQESDGYLNTRYGHHGGRARYADLEWGHELFCYGHLLQAAVAAARTAEPQPLLDIARRAADHVSQTFGAAATPKICGHPGIEMALVELFRVTAEERYLEQARLFIERRGHHTLADIEYGPGYFQDEVPVRDASTLRGHAVRALYLSAGAVDVAVETGDQQLLSAIVRQLNGALSTRTYITGGMGARHQDESFGDDFELPPDRAYAETCAGIAAMMLSWRLLLATGRSEYADLIERVLFNVVVGSPDQDGTSFFYTNTLHQREIVSTSASMSEPSPRAASGVRSPWFTVSCCPTNLARTFAALHMYFATADATGIQLHQYASSVIKDGQRSLTIDTEYPVSGQIRVRIEDSTPERWALSLRVPSWCGDATVSVNGKRTPALPGYARLERVWEVGDLVELCLPQQPRWSFPDPRIDAVRGTAVLERGPLVYCLQSNLHEPDINAVAVDPSSAISDSEEANTGSPSIAVSVRQFLLDRPRWPYQTETPSVAAATLSTRKFIPYFLRGNSGASTMRVFIPIDEAN